MGIYFHEDIRARLLSGIDRMADPVRVTMGPKGRNVAMHQKANIRDSSYADRAAAGAPVLITNDGVTIAKGIVLSDPLEDMGAQLLLQAAEKVNAAAGDGTSTAILLTQNLLHEAFRSLTAGADPVLLDRGIRAAAAEVKRALSSAARPIEREADIARIAAVSCGDAALGRLVANALHRVGMEGVITVEDGRRPETELDIQEGIVFDRGFLDPVMTTDEHHSVCELTDALILLTDWKFTDPQDLIPALILAAEQGRPILVVSEGVEGEAMGLVHKNKTEGDLDVVCVQAPLYGEGRRWRMEDLAIQTGGAYVSREHGMDIRRVRPEDLGSAERIRVTRGQTVITGAGGDPEAVAHRIRELRYYVEHTDYEFNLERHRERLARFVSGVAVLRVGGNTEQEIWERRMRVEDAVRAARAACAEGVVPGGGAALLHTLPRLEVLAAARKGDEQTGIRVMIEALKAPVRQIAENAGLEGGVIAAKLLQRSEDTVFDAEAERFGDAWRLGLLDPVLVTRQALDCAVSVATTVIMTEAGVTRKG